MTRVSINISVPEASPSKLKSLKASLSRQGVEIESVLETIGVITGKIARSKLSSLDVGDGATVELEQTAQIPPPDAPLQ